jgi:hypothetical protein
MDNMENCENILFVHVNKPGSMCPVDQINYPEVYVSQNPSSSDDQNAMLAERRVIELRNLSVQTVKEIQELEFAKAKVIEEEESVGKVKVPGIDLEDLNKDLQERVSRLVMNEDEDRKKVEDAEPDKDLNANIDILEAQAIKIG